MPRKFASSEISMGELMLRLLSLWGMFFAWIVVSWTLAGRLHPVLGSQWLPVRETKVIVRFTYISPYFGVVLPIYSADGARLYTLDCMGGDTEYLDRFHDRTGIDVVGPLMCKLVEGKNLGGGSLLSEGAYYDKPWFTRGYFPPEIFEEFTECRDYPDYGASRTFRLRGMRLNIMLERLEWGDLGVNEFEMIISVKNDSTSGMPTAESSIYRNPFAKGGDCRKPAVDVETLLNPVALMRMPNKFLRLGPVLVAGILDLEHGVLRLLPDARDFRSTLRGQRLLAREESGIMIEWRKDVDFPAECYGRPIVIRAVFDKLENGMFTLRISDDLEEIRDVRTNAHCWKAARHSGH